jgi:prevent-host-death family protein
MLEKDMRGLMESIIPISRFNKGEAGKIFEEVAKSGTKIVVKNNKPTCVLIDPKKYTELMEMIEDFLLLAEAEERTKSPKPSDFVSYEDAMKEFGVDPAELDDIDVEIE